MSQIQGCPCTPPPSLGLTPGHLTFKFFWSNSPPCGPFLWSNAPLPWNILGVKSPAPRAEVTKPRLISGNLNEVFNTAISIIFCIPVQRLRSSFIFCVHSDHLGSRYELSAFGTLQSSVSRQKEVQEHESVHSKFCNSRVFFRKFVTIRLQLLANKQILRKMYLALLVLCLVFLTFLPGLFVAGPRSEEEFKKWSLELRVVV